MRQNALTDVSVSKNYQRVIPRIPVVEGKHRLPAGLSVRLCCLKLTLASIVIIGSGIQTKKKTIIVSIPQMSIVCAQQPNFTAMHIQQAIVYCLTLS